MPTAAAKVYFVATAILFAVGAFPSNARAAGPVVSNGLVLLSGSVQIPDSSESVALEGSVHVVTRVTPVEGGHLVSVFANLPADVQATGPQETQFIAHGASHHADVHDISDGEIIPCVMPGFMLIQAGKARKSLAPIPFAITLNLRFSDSGELEEGSASVGVR